MLRFEAGGLQGRAANPRQADFKGFKSAWRGAGNPRQADFKGFKSA